MAICSTTDANCRHGCDRGLAAFEFAANSAIRKVEVRGALPLLRNADGASLGQRVIASCVDFTSE
jgi:hypothetical protein